MSDISIFKATYNLCNGINLTDMRQKFVTQAFTLGRAFNKPGYIYKAHCRRYDFFCFDHFSQNRQTFIRHINNTYIRFYSTKRIVGSLCSRFGNSIEQGAFADIRQTDYPYF